MSRLRDESEALVSLVAMGLCDVAEVIAWADAQIAREETPPGALCDVALAGDRYPQDVAGLLRQLPGVPDKSCVYRLVLASLATRIRVNPRCAHPIARGLYQMALADEIPDDGLREIAWWADDALDLAEAGYTQETRERVVDQLTAALQDAARGAAITWSVVP